MSDFKAALIERVGSSSSQVIKIPKLKVFHVKEKVKTPAWVGLENLQTIREATIYLHDIFSSASPHRHELFIFSNNAHETFLKLHGITGLKYLFTLNETKSKAIVEKINAVRALRHLEVTKEREISACALLEVSQALKSSTSKKFSTQKNNAEKIKKDIEKIKDLQYLELAKLLNNGWR